MLKMPKISIPKPNKFMQHIREQRKFYEIPPSRIAKLVGVSPTLYMKFETGHAKPTGLQRFIMLEVIEKERQRLFNANKEIQI